MDSSRRAGGVFFSRYPQAPLHSDSKIRSSSANTVSMSTCVRGHRSRRRPYALGPAQPRQMDVEQQDVWRHVGQALQRLLDRRVSTDAPESGRAANQRRQPFARAPVIVDDGDGEREVSPAT